MASSAFGLESVSVDPMVVESPEKVGFVLYDRGLSAMPTSAPIDNLATYHQYAT